MVDHSRSRGMLAGFSAILGLVLALAAPGLAWADTAPVMSDFMPYPDGYQFSNFAGAADWELYEDVFGGQVHVWSITDTAYYNNVFTTKYGGYVCYGFAATAGMFYRNVFGYSPGYYAPGAMVTWDIPQNTRTAGAGYLDEPIERHIEKYFYYQYSPEIRATRVGGYSADTAGVLVDFVEEQLNSGWEDPWFLCVFGPDYGHAVNIVGVERTADGAIFKVYNNNSPDDRVDPPEIKEFIWSSSGFTWGTRTITGVEARPTSAHERDHIDKWWGDPDFTQRYVLVSRSLIPDVFVLHTDALGRRFGQTAAAVFNEIPGAETVVAITGGPEDGYRPPDEQYLPLDDYTIDLSGAKGIAYQLFAGDTMLTVRTEGEGPTQGRVSTLSQDHGFVFKTRSGADALRASLVNVQADESERAVDVAIATLPGGSLAITRTLDGSGFDIRPSGTGLTACDLKLTAASPSGQVSAAFDALALVDGAALEVVPWDWCRLEEMPVYIRTTSDAGETLEVFNATPANLYELLDDMVASGAIPTRGIATSIRKQIERAPLHALESHLACLVADGRLAADDAELILATAQAVAPPSSMGLLR